MNPMDITQFEQLKASGNLPSPKGVALAIMRLTQKEDASMAELARIIKSDPAFVGRLIKAANSVNANPGRPVVSVQEALVILGMPTVRNLALGFSLLSQYKHGACKGFDYPKYWSSCLACGIALQALTVTTRAAQAEEAFSVGLLARVGELALATLYPEQYADILRTAAPGDGDALVRLESDRLAMSHRELTAAMLADWGLPKIFCETVNVHELSDEAPFREGSRECILMLSLALSRLIADICVAGEAVRTALMPRLFLLGGKLSIDNEDLLDLCDGVVRDWTEWAAIFSVSTGSVPRFEELAKAHAAEGSAPSVQAADKAPHLRVLVVDDDCSIRLVVRTVLQEAGYDVVEAADGEEALRVALEVQPQILVVDRVMPRQDGLALVRALRETDLGRGMYILMLTALGDEEKLVEGFEVGVDDYLSKPLNQRLLKARLRAGQRVVRLYQEMEHDRDELRRFAAELAVTNRRLQEAALTDVLTGFPNRRYAMERIQQEWSASARSTRPLSCMVLDCDQFKGVNDTHGHDAGDAYLRQVALAVRGAVRAQDVVCRTGGDEFLVICPDTPLPAAIACAERVRRAVEQTPISVGKHAIKATLSLGVAVRVQSMANVDALIKCADEGVYLAKQQGRNRVATPQSFSNH
jgi:diguanylate cyclase (GGDEF)-like protein